VRTILQAANKKKKIPMHFGVPNDRQDLDLSHTNVLLTFGGISNPVPQLYEQMLRKLNSSVHDGSPAPSNRCKAGHFKAKIYVIV
jgi:hypothetical protein